MFDVEIDDDASDELRAAAIEYKARPKGAGPREILGVVIYGGRLRMESMSTAIYEDALRVLFAQTLPAAMPPPVVPLNIDLGMPWKPAVLVVGAVLPALEVAALVERGCDVETVNSFVAGLQRMHVARWNIVVVGPSVQTEGDGVRFVRSFKNADPRSLPASIADLVPRYERIPFVIVPVAGSTEYAVFRTGAQWELADASMTPLSRAILKARS